MNSSQNCLCYATQIFLRLFMRYSVGQLICRVSVFPLFYLMPPREAIFINKKLNFIEFDDTTITHMYKDMMTDFFD